MWPRQIVRRHRIEHAHVLVGTRAVALTRKRGVTVCGETGGGPCNFISLLSPHAVTRGRGSVSPYTLMGIVDHVTLAGG
jgi:hypothetical protein